MGNKNVYPVNPGKAGLKLFNIIKFIAVILFFSPTAGLHAQQAIPASGGDATGSETTIPVANLTPAVYFLKVMQTWPSYRELKTFKIIKN